MINTALESRCFEFGSFTLDIADRSLLCDGRQVQITQKSFEILRLLVENQGRILTKQEILDEVWTENFVEESTLTQHVYMVRKALRREGAETEFIETVPKYGYRFKEPVTEQVKPVSPSRRFPKDAARTSVSTSYSISELKTGKGQSNSAEPKRRFRPIVAVGSAAAISLVLMAFALLPLGRADNGLSDIDSIAVLPFDQIGEPKDERLGLGLADSVIAKLSEAESVPVSPTSTVATYSRDGVPSIDIGRKLGVKAILTGTIQRDGERVRVNVQLVSVERSVPVWTDTFDSRFSDTFSLQDVVSERIAVRLSRGFGAGHEMTTGGRDHVLPDRELPIGVGDDEEPVSALPLEGP